MKTKRVVGRLGGAVMGIFMLAVGCADGQLQPIAEEGSAPAPQLAAPVIAKFEANPLAIDAGGSTTLSWEVEGADKIEITASGANSTFNYSTEKDLKGSTVVADLKETTTFILVATKLAAQPAANAEPPAEGEKPAESTSPEQKPEEAKKPDEKKPDEKKPEEATPAEGEKPAEGTTEPTASQEPVVARATVTVTVNQAKNALTIEEFSAEADLAEDGVSYVLEKGKTTVLHWSVVPAEAVVALASSTGEQPVLVDCAGEAETTKALEEGGEVPAAFPATGCATVAPQEDTTYTLNATLDKETASQELSVTMAVAEEEKPAEAKPAEPAASTDLCHGFSAFADANAVLKGERITIRWTAPASLPATVKTVRVKDASGAVVATGDVAAGFASVVATPGSYKVVLMDGETEINCEQPSVQASVARLDGQGKEKAISLGTALTETSSVVYAGLDQGGFKEGSVEMALKFSPDREEIGIDYFGAFSGDKLMKTFNKRWYKDIIQNYPANVVAANPSNGRLFVGTTGGILYKDGEATKLLSKRVKSDPDGTYSGSHPTCFGKTQAGEKGYKNGLVSLSQVCDLVINGSGRMIAADDHGITTMDDIEGFIANREGKEWQRIKGDLYFSVVNDLEIVADNSGGETIYAAGAKGVYQSSDEGATWTSLNVSSAVYSVAVAKGSDGSQTLVAATDGAVLLKSLNVESEWRRVEIAGRIYAVAGDPYVAGSIYAGGEQGLYVSRDGGATFNAVPLVDEGSQPIVRSIKAVYSGDPTVAAADAYLYVATEAGVYRASFPAIRINPPPVIAPTPELPPVVTPPTPPVVGGGDLESTVTQE